MASLRINSQPDERITAMIAIAPPVQRQVDAAALPQLVDDFLVAKAKQISERSAVGYRLDLAPFLAWWNQRQNHILTDDSFTEMTGWIAAHYRNGFGQPATATTIWRTTKRVRQLLTWAHTKGYIPVSLTDMCPLYPADEKEKYWPDTDDLTAMLAACSGDSRLRDSALILFAAATGARRFEIAAVDVSWLRFDTPMTQLYAGGVHSGFVHLQTVKRDTQGIMRPRWSMFDSSTGLMLKAYIRAANVTGSLFGLTDNGIQLLVRRIGRVARLPRIHPHAFRHCLIDHWREENASAGVMADLALKMHVGHALPKSDVTTRYQNWSNWQRNMERIRQFYRSPVERIEIDWSLYPVHLG